MNSIEQAGKKFAGATELFARRHGPAILTACGIAGFAATTILTGKAVLKAQEPVKKLKLKVQRAREMEKEELKAARVEIGKDAIQIARIFAPAVTTGSVAVFCLVASHGMMRKNQAALAAAYVALQEGFTAYRARVREEIGEERELELWRRPKILTNADDPELPCEIDYGDRMPSAYARFFDESSRNWTKTPEWNRMFVQAQQDWANDRLRAYGFLFLNEVYEELGLERTQAGQIVGWSMQGNGDKYVDFGVYDIADENNRAFVNGLEGVILLDFNVDGPIAI
jgi:Family of unknown function (DUF6353)